MSGKKKKKEKDLKYSGWLKKKGKKRYFIIVDEWLFWFNKEPKELEDGGRHPKSWAFLTQANGNLFLSRCNVSDTVKTKEIVIVNPSGKNYILVGKDTREIQQWKEVIAAICEVDATALPSYTDGQLIEKRGMMRYRGEPHWFVLKEGALMWFKSEEDPNLVGSTTLYNATVAVGTTKTGVGFVVATVENKFVVGCDNREMAEEWVTYMKAAISAAKQSRALASETNKMAKVGVSSNASEVEHHKVDEDVQLGPEHSYKGYLMYEGQSLAFLLRSDVIMWFKSHISDLAPSNLKKHIKGHLILHPDRVQLSALPSSNDAQTWRYGFQLTVQGVTHEMYAQTSNDRDDWIGVINGVFIDVVKKTKLLKGRTDSKEVLEHEGWLIRKRVKKWVCVRDNMMHVFDRPGQVGQAKTTVVLGGCSVLQSEDPSAKQLMLFSTNGLEVLESVSKKPEEATLDQQDWFYVLFKSIFDASQDPAMLDSASRPQTELEGDTPDGDSYYEQQRAGWLHHKKDKEDYYFTLKSLSLIWYLSDNLVDYKGSLLLCGCNTSVKGTELTISASDDRTLCKVITSNDDDASGWALALEDAIQSANESKGYRKFGYLERKGKRRWMVLTKTHLFWFPAPRRLEDLRANKGDQLQLTNCSVTTQGEAIVVTERIAAKKGAREGVTVEILVPTSADEQRDWVAALLTCVTREYSKDFLGIPYAVFTFMLSSDEDDCLLQLGTMTGQEEGLHAKVLTPPSKAILFQVENGERGGLIDAEGVDVFDVQHRVFYQPDGLGADSFMFQFSSDSLQIDGVASVTVKKNDKRTGRSGGSGSPRPSPRSNLSKSAHVPSVSPRTASPQGGGASPRAPPRSPRQASRGSLKGALPPAGPAPTPPPSKSPRGRKPVPSLPSRPLPADPRPVPPLRTHGEPGIRSSLNLPLRGARTSPRNTAEEPAKWIAQVFLYQRAKRKLEGGRWVAVAEDVTRVQTPESLCARQDLEGLVMETPSELVSLLMANCPMSEADQAIQAIINVHESHGDACELILRYISDEVAAANKANTMFRTNSPATKMMKFYSAIIGRSLLHDALSAGVQAVVTGKGGWEIDAERLPAGEDISLNLERLVAQCELFLNGIFASLTNFPLEFHRISGALASEVGRKFPEHQRISVGGFLFLRFFCPAIVAPESYGLSAKPPGGSARRGLTLCAKTLQNISNGKVFGAKEGFMVAMNPLIERYLPLIQEFFDQAAVIPGADDARSPAVSNIPKRVVERSLETIFKHCVLQKRKMAKTNPQFVSRHLTPIIKAIGIAPNLRRVLMIQQKAANAKKEKANPTQEAASPSMSLAKSPRAVPSPRGKARNK